MVEYMRHCRGCNAWLILDSTKNIGNPIKCHECGAILKAVGDSCRLIFYPGVVVND